MGMEWKPELYRAFLIIKNMNNKKSTLLAYMSLMSAMTEIPLGEKKIKSSPKRRIKTTLTKKQKKNET